MSLNPQVLFPSAAVLILLLGCGGEAPTSGSAPPQPSPAAVPGTPAPVTAVTDPFGYYLLEDADALPAWARSIDHLHLSNVDLQGEEMVTVPLWGHLRMKEEAGGRDHRLEPVRLEGQALSFATQEIDGISYAFEGDFLVSGELPAQAPTTTGANRMFGAPVPTGGNGAGGAIQFVSLVGFTGKGSRPSDRQFVGRAEGPP